MMYGDGWGMGWMLIMLVLWGVLTAGVVWVAVRWAQGSASRGGGPVQQASALEILDRRFAAGEIDAASYDEARVRLAGPGPGRP
ncbi:SHOCT domain-containing protein [Longispora sp. NPDC051575]|uniref:SHOCT domain-containing protein n=1 Tax=Longispora sp. NPDC051575 TaxID=3154943 RepID=UPI003416E35D